MRNELETLTAEREGFEPSERFPVQHISSVLHSTALAPLLYRLPYHAELLESIPKMS